MQKLTKVTTESLIRSVTTFGFFSISSFSADCYNHQTQFVWMNKKNKLSLSLYHHNQLLVYPSIFLVVSPLMTWKWMDPFPNFSQISSWFVECLTRSSWTQLLNKEKAKGASNGDWRCLHARKNFIERVKALHLIETLSDAQRIINQQKVKKKKNVWLFKLSHKNGLLLDPQL